MNATKDHIQNYKSNRLHLHLPQHSQPIFILIYHQNLEAVLKQIDQQVL